LLKTLLPVLEKVRGNLPSFGDDAIARVIDFFPAAEDYHIRRQISVSRVARSLAQLNRKNRVTAEDVDEAATVIGLRPPPLPPSSQANSSTSDPQAEQADDSALIAPSEFEETKLVAEANKVEGLPGDQLWENISLSFSASPYAEDTAPSQREYADLRYLTARRSKRRRGEGPIIGIEKADALIDLSITATIFEAAKFRRVRCKNNPSLGDSLVITPPDLRKYRRSAKPDRMLILLIDHTCIQAHEERESRVVEAIEDTLAAHLRWAYLERAAVSVIEVGRSDAANELCAKKVSAESVIAARIGAALDFKPGRATPLAHGLHLAYDTLRHSMWQGRGQPQQVRLVIFTDGRGNVPLSASLGGEIRPPVQHAGIEDSFEQARKIQDFSKSEGLRRVEVYFIAPQAGMTDIRHRSPRLSPQDVRVKMAREMNAKLYLVQPRVEAEE
jgi:magnesium chelatase subunit D